ncbi:MAG TPA: ferredoxin [Cyanothece sp. UBA12306]|nr:ferredoxin [Cyanothece sp. UBA12306]
MSNNNDNFSVALVNENKGLDQTIRVSPDEYILDIAETKGINHPYSCRTGSCFDCLAKVVEGTVEQTTKALEFLRPDELEAGYVLLCASSPTSNCKIVTHQAEEYLD